MRDFQDQSAYSAAGKYVDRSWEYINLMHVEIGTEAVQFSEKKYINGIFLAVCSVLTFTSHTVCRNVVFTITKSEAVSREKKE